MKRLVSVLIFLLMLTLLLPVNVLSVRTEPDRVINVVYDDSGSMYQNGNMWCQAKYSLEVFAAMLGSTDRMNVYYMSDYYEQTDSPPRIVLEGRDGAAVNVAKIHGEKTVSSWTPFDAVRKAYSDLSKDRGDEKWLVVLTDGVFDNNFSGAKVDAFFAEKDKDIKVLFLGMGARAASIKPNEAAGIFYYKAENSKNILSQITSICMRIFNSNSIKANTSNGGFSFDVPMGELIVFAQGKNVQLEGITPEGGRLIKPDTKLVDVRYSECDASNRKSKPDTSLVGSIAIYRGNFDTGNYVVNASDASSIEVFYKPNVEIAAYLEDTAGNLLEDVSRLKEGDYVLRFGFVKAGTKERLPTSQLLGQVDYLASVMNNGVSDGSNYTDGDTLHIAEGELRINVTARFLSYNSVSTELVFTTINDQTITFSVRENPTYKITAEGMAECPPIVIDVRFNGAPPSAEQWKEMELPVIRLERALRDFRVSVPTVEKGAKAGELLLYPVVPGNKPSAGTYGDYGYAISYEQNVNYSTWRGEAAGTVHMIDTRTWLQRNWIMFVRLAILGAVLVILFGYLPFVKHYLPKTLKKRPYIKCVPSEPGEKRKDREGEFEKSLPSTIVPYIPQTGTIKYVPTSVAGVPALKVRAIKNRRMTIANIKAFAGKDYITFDGESIKKDDKKYDTNAGVTIRVKRKDWTYICIPNQENK